MANGDGVPLFFTASSLEKEGWNDHAYLRHMGDGVQHIYDMLGGGGVKGRASTLGTILGVAMTTAALILATIGGWHP